MIRRREDPHSLAAPYALDALESAGRARYERHLARCERCRQEVGGLREAAAGLALLAAEPPPPGLRARVLAAAAATPQETPGAGKRPAGLVGGGPVGAGPVGGGPAGGGAVGGGPAGARRGRGGGGRQRGPLPVAPRLATAVAGMALLITLGLGALTVSARNRLGLAQASGQAVAAVLTAPDATMMTAHGRAGGTATVVMSHRRRALILTTAALPALPAGERYEVWLMGPAGTRAAGMLPPPQGGMTAPMYVPGLAAGDRIGVSMEPAAGARRPSSVLVVLMVLPS